MMKPMDSLQSPERQMRVHLRRRNIGMSKKCLYGAQVGAVLDHVCGAAVSQLMRTGVRVARFDQPPHPLPRQRLTARRKKKLVRATASSQYRTPALQIFIQRLHTW